MRVRFLLSFLLCIAILGGWQAVAQFYTPMGAQSSKTAYYIATGDSLLRQEMAKEAIVYYQAALSEAELHRQSQYEMQAHLKLGQSFLTTARFDEALAHIKKAEAHPALRRDSEEHAKVLSLAGAVYENLGSYEQAFQYQLKALDSRERMKDSLGIAESLYKIGSLYFYQKKYKEALDNYEDALAICQSNQAIPAKYTFNCLSAIGSAYERMGMQKEALDFNLQALKLAEGIGNDRNKAYALLNIGEIYAEQGIWGQAQEALSNALRIGKAMSLVRVEILAYKNLGQLYLKQNQMDKALLSLNQAYALCKETNSNSTLVEVLQAMAAAHEANYNYAAANQYLLEYTALKDSLLNETTVREISRLNTLYEVEKKESEIQILQKEKDLFKAEQRADQLTNTILIGASIFLLILSGLFFYWMTEQRKSNIKLQSLNRQIENQNRQLASYNEELRQYAYVASHDLQEPLRTIASFVTILKRKYTDQLDDQARQYMDYVTEGVSRLQRLLKDLLAYTRIDREKTDFDVVHTGTLVRTVLDSLQETIREAQANILFDETVMPVVKGNSLRLSQVFQNLISNAIKFRGEAPPEVEIGCLTEADKGEHLFYVRDNGIGVPADFQTKMFEMFTRLHARHEYEGSGIGLATCRKIVENHGGRIWAESEPGMGTAIFFTLPMLGAVRAEEERNRVSSVAAVM